MRRRHLAVSVAVLAVLALSAGCDVDGDGDATPSTSPDGRIPVVVDTDLAGDDLTALWFLLSSPELDVRAVTVSGTGEVRCPRGAEVARQALAVTGDDDVPVACGRTSPLDGEHAFPSEWRDGADDAWGLDLPPASDPVEERTAVELLAEVLDPGGVTVVTLGPLTNLADAFRAHDHLPGRIASIVAMGGAVDVPGNVEVDGEAPVAEWNVFVDPTAAEEVLASGAPVTLVGLDATNQAPITGDVLELLRVNATTDAARLTQELLLNNPLVWEARATFWDQLAAAVAVDPTVVATEEARIEVSPGDGADSGRTSRSDDGHTVAVAVDADALAFEELLVRRLAGLGDDEALVAPPMTVGEVVVRLEGSSCTFEGPDAVEPGRLRMAFESEVAGSGGAIAHLTGELGIDEIIDWFEQNPGGSPPGVDLPVAADGPGAVTYLDVVTGTEAVVCGLPSGEILVAGTFEVG